MMGYGIFTNEHPRWVVHMASANASSHSSHSWNDGERPLARKTHVNICTWLFTLLFLKKMPCLKIQAARQYPMWSHVDESTGWRSGPGRSRTSKSSCQRVSPDFASYATPIGQLVLCRLNQNVCLRPPAAQSAQSLPCSAADLISVHCMGRPGQHKPPVIPTSASKNGE